MSSLGHEDTLNVERHETYNSYTTRCCEDKHLSSRQLNNIEPKKSGHSMPAFPALWYTNIQHAIIDIDDLFSPQSNDKHCLVGCKGGQYGPAPGWGLGAVFHHHPRIQLQYPPGRSGHLILTLSAVRLVATGLQFWHQSIIQYLEKAPASVSPFINHKYYPLGKVPK